MKKIVVVGTNHAGTHAVTTCKAIAGESAQIITYDKNDNISFLGCGMALWIGDVINSPEGLFYATPESLKEQGIKVNMKHDVTDVSFKDKKIIVKNLETNEEFEQKYDKLIFASGSWPILPPIPGSDLKNIKYAKIYQNAVDVIDTLKNDSVNDVTVVGAGYIGVELAEAFKLKGKKVTLINDFEVLNRYYDEEFQKRMHDRLVENGINVKIGERAIEFKGNAEGFVNEVITDKGSYKTDLVLMSIGFKPNTEFLKDSGLEFDARGAIITNNKQETNIKDVYAVGDCTTVYNNAIEDNMNICLATNAVRTGIVSAYNACDVDVEMLGVQGSNAIHIFGLTLCSTGLTEQEAKNAGFDVDSVTVTEWLKPEFMPDNDKVTLKVVWDKKSKRILGAQMASDTDITLALHFFSLAVQEKYPITKLALTDLFFLPHFNQPHNFITKAGLIALTKI